MINLDKLLNLIVCVFLPNRCPYCNVPVRAFDTACIDCAEEIKPGMYETYAIGGYKCKSPFPYKGIYKDAVLGFKFKQRPSSAKSLAIPLAECIKTGYGDIRFDCVTFVPMHKKQLRRRGYNQSALLAREVSRCLNLNYSKLLIKSKENKPQHTLKQAERRKNVKGVYCAINSDRFKGKTVLLIDDVVTTGYTLGECCRVLRKAGIKKVYCAALCARQSSEQT